MHFLAIIYNIKNILIVYLFPFFTSNEILKESVYIFNVNSLIKNKVSVLNLKFEYEMSYQGRNLNSNLRFVFTNCLLIQQLTNTLKIMII